jgi:PEP-CTERM motif-containing protein
MKLMMFLLLCLTIAAMPCFADSVTFNTVALQNNGFVSVPLGSGLNPLLKPTSPPTFLDFITSFGPLGTVTLSSTLDLAGQQFTFGPFATNCVNPAGCGDLFGWLVPVSHKVIDGTLTVNLNGTSETYNFRYVSPVPEPTTLTLIGTGLLAGFSRKRSRVP